MPLSNSVIRRYTPPTCTLEVLAQSSPLSRWMGKPVLRQLTFELRFDDPQLLEENRVPIRGDRDQLETLCDAVTTYVQQFLQQPPESFWLSFSGVEDSTKVTNQDLTDSYQAALLPTTSKSFTPQILGTSIYLEPGDNLTHNLYLGSLANPVSGPFIQLSLLQLFDLATALDEYSTDVMALPALNNTSSVARLPAWTPVAAVLVLALGLTPLTWQYANNRQKDQQVAKTNNSTNQQIALQPAPAPNVPAPQAEITPSNNLSPLPIGSTPPPPSATLPITPLPPNITNSALVPNSLRTKPGQNQPQLQIPSLPSNSSPTLPGQQIAIQPNPTTSINPQGITLKRSLPPRLSTSTSSTSSSIPPVPPPLATIPNPIPQVSPVTTQPVRSRSNSSVNTPLEAPDTSPFIDRGDKPKTPSNRAVVSTNNSDTLFDTPQVAEAREFLRKRWQPPSGFSQTLEYSLLLGVDGSIERILPLGKAARDNIEMAGMPAIGEPFVSANRSGQMTRIRVLLSPDGKVQTFPESE
ncbi:hypothetical protein NOS3756_18340 [Nostoc sp. NIES-3756]|uniref:DUF4335 domain-containing protein n=1 Tax=Nostoc sp. NIES-3756 TaxID=1751286 RepID=UPI0007210389|nr:DUF4335 domain-containing protein [Nostoc sp. NIES-3756]BAT52893.1 hypothetical protein NOS3756_18340 [Nostoc sp. NIES-3756]